MSYRKIILILCLGIFLSAERDANAQTSTTFNYVSSATQTWTVPPCVTSVTVQLWGAGGGSGYYDGYAYEFTGGSGAYYTGTITGLTTGDVLTLYVPSGGAYSTSGVGGLGGWPGGGNGGNDNLYGEEGGGGGGYAAIAINGTYYVVCGGGGGGGSTEGGSGYGGAGGATTGSNAGTPQGTAAKGGTIAAGGAAAVGGYSNCDPGSAGTSLTGGAGGGLPCSNGYGGGGGGAGYFGGGGGGDYGGGGGGGSSYPTTTTVANGFTFTKITNTVGTSGNNMSSYIAPGTPPAGVGTGSYQAKGGNGAIIITYIPLIANIVIMNNDSCRGQNDGEVRVTEIGGTSPFTYSWSPIGGTRDTATGLGEGTYTVTVISPCGATATASVSITQPNILGATATTTQEVQCNAGHNGQATGNPLGGAAPFTYLWSDGSHQTTNPATGLSAGSYTVTITDHCGETATATTTLTQPPVMSAISVAVTANVLCNGMATGSADVTSIIGGGSPYTYSWTPGTKTSNPATGLSAGNYTVTVKDACGASETAGITITQPATAISFTTAVTSEVSCNGGNNGMATATVTGGIVPYTYTWSGGQTTSSATNLTAASYTITVKDNNGCSESAKVTITAPTKVAVTTTVSANVHCNGGSTGSATCTPSGGTAPYTYNWTPGNSNTQAINGLSAQVYTVTITDNHGCTASKTATVTQPGVLTVSASTTENIICNSDSNGQITSIAGAGTTPYTYLWSPGGQTTASVTRLPAGVYTITLMDNCGASVSALTTITQPNVLAGPAYSLFNVLCNGGTEGVAIDSAAGGTAPYTYAWTPVISTNQSITSLASGTYSVALTDNHGCSFSTSTTITQPNVLTVSSATTANVLCNGQNNGSASSTITGGTMPFTYSWSPGAGTMDTAVGLTAGTYTLNVTDNHGCMGSSTVTITEPATLAVSAYSPANVICNGGNDGMVNSVASGGTGPYTYVWSFGGLNSNGAGLSASTYTITVLDAHYCSATAQTTITQPISLIVGAGTVLNNLCYNVNIGTVVAYVAGGPAPYTYLWSSGAGTRDTANGLGIGVYTVNVTDKDGCTGSAQTTVTQPTQLTFTTDSVQDDGSCTGSAWVYPQGGVGPYSYLWTTGATAFSISNECKGYYCCLITDANGCEANTCFHISSDLGVDNVSAGGDKITVYPNPTNGEFTIQTNANSGQSIVEIYNVLGAKIYSTSMDANKGGTSQINISTQPNGIYLYRVISNTNGNLLGEGKIVLEK